MAQILALVGWISNGMHAIAGASLVFLMGLTLLDVLLRWYGAPIAGTYELVWLAGGIAIGLAMPVTSLKRAHVFVDTFLWLMPRKARVCIRITTRIVSALLFAVLAWNLVDFGLDLRASGEVTPTLEIKFYPVVFGLAAASVLQALVLLAHIDTVRRDRL
jgi:TRAP-type C4-dicarboxylate transport system permease small subunit